MIPIVLFLLRISAKSNGYEQGDVVVPWINKIGPDDNPTETYLFNYLNIFKYTDNVQLNTPKRTIGDFLVGNSLVDVGFRLIYTKDEESKKLGKLDVNSIGDNKISNAISRKFWIQFFIDDLPIYYHIGEKSGNVSKIYTELKFVIECNENQIVEANIIGSNPISVNSNSEIDITYSVKWKQTTKLYADRFNRYNNINFSNHFVHKYSIINSALLVLLLAALVFFILKSNIARDYDRYQQEADFDGFDFDRSLENGWRVLHGNVFRPPKNVLLVSVLAGAGLHLFLTLIITSIIIDVQKVSILTNSLFGYGLIVFIFTSPFCSFISVSLSRAFSYQKWKRVSIFSTIIFPIIYIIINIIYNIFNTYKISYITFIIMIMSIVINSILSLIGGLIAMKLKLFEGNKCEVSLVPRQIPRKPFYLQNTFIYPIVGLLCSSSILIEIYYIFCSIWDYSGAYSYSYLIIVLFLLILSCSCATILMVYILLQNEDYHWQWPSFCAPSTTALFVFIYSIYFMFVHTKINGVAQVICFMCNSLTLSLILFLLAGGIGYTASSVFVHKLYNDLKLD